RAPDRHEECPGLRGVRCWRFQSIRASACHMTPRPRVAASPDPPGLLARRIAADILDGVLRRRRPLDEQLDGAGAHPELAGLAERDRALVRALTAMVLRRLGTLRHLLGQYLDCGLPADAPRLETTLL